MRNAKVEVSRHNAMLVLFLTLSWMSSETWIIEPGLQWVYLQNRLQLALDGHIETQCEEAEKSEKHGLRLIASWHF